MRRGCPGRRRPQRLPEHEERPLRRGGFATIDDAQAELGAARELLTIAAPDDDETRIRIADAIAHAVKTTRRLPDTGSLRKAIRLGHDPAAPQVTVGQWLEEWLRGKRNLRPATVKSSYEPHIRLYFQPHIGHIRLAKLRVADVASVFDAIDELNDTITQAREAATRPSAPRNMSSPAPTAPRCTPLPSQPPSNCSPTSPDCHPSGCTTFATAPPSSPK